MSARISLDPRRQIGDVSPLIFGGFAEHLGRCVYEGMYDPTSPLADEDGFRTDVLDALRELDFPVIRYPGGNFVSGYRWEDGVGPKGSRPKRKELAWSSIESNQFGTNEFVAFCRKIGSEPMLAVNLGTGTPQDAANLVEYCNSPVGTLYGDLRASHGYPAPHGVKYWCLGNEMDGPWQIGHLNADDYAKKALEAAKMMKWHDPSIILVACGSSGTGMNTFPVWDRITLESLWDKVEYLSLHHYANNNANNTRDFLAYANHFQEHLDALRGVLLYVKSQKRSKHDVYLSWDEWNVWYKNMEMNGRWTEAPHLLEEVYNHEDALVVAQWLNIFLRNADVLKAACLAQIVNVIAPILTNESGLVKQTTFHPIEMMRRLAKGASLAAHVDCKTVETSRFGAAPILDVAATADVDSIGVFVVNRSVDEAVEVEIEVPFTSVRSARVLVHSDPKVANTFENPDVVVPTPLDVSIVDGILRYSAPPMSFAALDLAR